MTDADKKDFAEIMVALAENYSQTLTKQGLSLRFTALREHDIADIRAAAMSLMVSRRYTTMPTVADFLDHLGGGSQEDRAEVEAGKVLLALREHGGYRSVVFDDPVTMAVVEKGFGGWTKLCEELRGAEEKFWRRDFVRMYAAYGRQGIKTFGHLPGRLENRNGSNGFLGEVPAPVLIGDERRAAAVLAAGEARQALEEGAGRPIPRDFLKALPDRTGKAEAV
ncbi:DUF6475 domain-containing protein [Desulfovibrio fairfieldensis]|uniref:DUF6475 domain-containing protein n=1 Tax=Desulfovibrio fairfieldensis TaxID=44742 RepID=A0A0X8JIK1_9BACT|nr:DUF6475 domain-containing protein [Desulfovibrio fairfieldensis]AMD89460.1 hypothetical protein AXF13_04665 [Desulfovibrio fairfieldensis]